MLNRSPINRQPINSTGNIEYSVRYNVQLSGAFAEFNPFSQQSIGHYGIVYLRFDKVESRGRSALLREFAADSGGRYGLGLNRYSVDLTGVSKWYLNFTGSASGKALLLQTVNGEIARGAYGISAANYTQVISGGFSVAYESYSAEIHGSFELNGFYAVSHTLRGAAVSLQSYGMDQRGLSRIANDDLIGYELYLGINADPDFTAEPYAEFDALPYETPELTEGNEYRFVLRQRNAWDLQSRNVRSWSVVIAGDGESESLPAAVTNPTLIPAESGRVLVSAFYYYQDEISPADQFVLYLKTGGDDPDPETDTPIFVTMVKSSGVAQLKYLSLPYANDTTVKALIQTRRSTDEVSSISSSILTATTSTTGPVAPIGSALFGRVAGQK